MSKKRSTRELWCTSIWRAAGFTSMNVNVHVVTCGRRLARRSSCIRAPSASARHARIYFLVAPPRPWATTGGLRFWVSVRVPYRRRPLSNHARQTRSQPASRERYMNARVHWDSAGSAPSFGPSASSARVDSLHPRLCPEPEDVREHEAHQRAHHAAEGRRQGQPRPRPRPRHAGSLMASAWCRRASSAHWCQR